MPLTAAEILKHPAFPTVIWDLPPTSQGKVAVANSRGGPISIAYEIHGTGPIHLVWLMGLGGFKWSWQRQIKDFGHDQGSKYSCLIFDNRGMGESDKPVMRYSTSEMAQDILDLLDYLGWKAKRQLHVIGVSMGGMIAQEMAYLQPERIASLSLISTAAQIINTMGYFEYLRNRINIFIPKSINAQLAEVKSHVSPSYLSSLDDDTRSPSPHFPTSGDRFAARELTKRLDTTGFTRTGFICQALAVGYHRKSPLQLKEIGDRVGRGRIMVVHGTGDNLITMEHAGILVEGLGGERGGVRKVVVEGGGHYLPLEVREEFGGWVEECVERGEGMNAGVGVGVR